MPQQPCAIEAGKRGKVAKKGVALLAVRHKASFATPLFNVVIRWLEVTWWLSPL